MFEKTETGISQGGYAEPEEFAKVFTGKEYHSIQEVIAEKNQQSDGEISWKDGWDLSRNERQSADGKLVNRDTKSGENIIKTKMEHDIKPNGKMTGTILGCLGVYEPFAKWAGAALRRPFKHRGISAALIFGYLESVLFKPKMKE